MSCVRPHCVCCVLRAHAQFCGLIRRTPPLTFCDTAITDHHSDTTIFQLRAHWVRISWSIGSEKLFRHVPPVGVEPLTSWVQGEHPIHLARLSAKLMAEWDWRPSWSCDTTHLYKFSKLMAEWDLKFIQMSCVTWPRWPPCPYMVKTFKIFSRTSGLIAFELDM